MKHTIDAQGKRIGRIASQAAAFLMGKDKPTFAKNKIDGSIVEVVNASRMDITALKKTRDVYVTYTGYRGGLEKETLGELIARRGMKEVIGRAVRRMLPDNKLRDERLKHLVIKD